MAVGLSPRTESKHTIRRPVATAELSTGTGVFNRRDATRDNADWSLRGLKSTATFTASLREAAADRDGPRSSGGGGVVEPGRTACRTQLVSDPVIRVWLILTEVSHGHETIKRCASHVASSPPGRGQGGFTPIELLFVFRAYCPITR